MRVIWLLQMVVGQVQSTRLNVQCVQHVTTPVPLHLRHHLSRRLLLLRHLPLTFVLPHPLPLAPEATTTTLHRHHRQPHPPVAAAAVVITTIHHLHPTKITLLALHLHPQILLFPISRSTSTILLRLHNLLLSSSLIFLLFSSLCSLSC